MEIPVKNIEGRQVDTLVVEEDALGGAPNMRLVRQAVITHEANQRVGTARSKTRADVKFSGHKLYRQKHTGRARAGDRGSIVRVGGGTAHGPKARDYRMKLSKKMRAAATRSAFLAKALDGEIIVVDKIDLPELKTRCVADMLGALEANRSFMIVLTEHDGDLWRCARNIPGASMGTWQELNAYRMIRPQRVIFTLDAIKGFLDAACGAPAAQEAGVSDDE